ncbi:MAG: transposase [Nannocystales bacterium]
MAETAALLVEHRLPEVPWRQWVLSFEGPMAVRLGYDRGLLGRVCQRFAKRVMQTLRGRTKCAHGLRSSGKLHPGVLIVVQRFRSDLRLYVHLHALVTDGCFEAPAKADEAVMFRPAASLCEQDLLRTLQRLHGELAEHLEDGDSEPVGEALAACVQLALPARTVGPLPCESRPASPMLVRGFGMQLHAAVTVDGRDRKRLERVCRYLLRPPFALDAVQRTADGQVRVHFKKPNRFGATYAQMSPHTFLARLRALVPPPRAHTVLYYGVLSGHHALRSAVVPWAEEPAPEPKQLAMFVPRGAIELPGTTTLLETQLRDAAPSRLSWMTLLARVFRIDISVCARCSGPMRVTRAFTTPEDIAAELHGARPPPRGPLPGQLVLFSALP